MRDKLGSFSARYSAVTLDRIEIILTRLSGKNSLGLINLSSININNTSLDKVSSCSNAGSIRDIPAEQLA